MIYEFGYKTKTGFVRNKFCSSLEEVKKLALEAGNLDVYSSIFGYENKAVETSNVYSGLYFDIDNEDLRLAYKDLQALLGLFKLQGIRQDDFTICFSGCKGFHVYIFPTALDILPTTDLPQVFRKIGEEVLTYLPNKSLDLKVYERRRLWRLINSRHGKSGLHKIQLPRPLPSLKQIFKLAKKKQLVTYFETQPNIILSGWVRRARRELYEPKKKRYKPISFKDKSVNPKVEELLKGVSKGERNQTCFYLGCYLKSMGFSESETRQHLLNFGRNCNPPLHEREIETTLQSALKERPL